jgi:predicted phage-related endonuclease
MELVTPVQVMRYDLMTTLYKYAMSRFMDVMVYEKYILQPIVQNYCLSIYISDAKDICLNENIENMESLINNIVYELLEFWPTTYNTHTVGMALKLIDNLSYEEFTESQFYHALNSTDINLDKLLQCFDRDTSIASFITTLSDETITVMNFILHGN